MSSRSSPPKAAFHPGTAARRNKGLGKLRLRDAVAMAVGGMIGGGIFSVLGVTVALAGHLAVGSFLIGGGIAIVTAHSFAALSARAGRSGGLFVYLQDAGYPRVGSYISWLLMFGYLVALAVYGFTFGHYAANVLGLPGIFADGFAALILLVFLGINLRGVGASALSEDIVVLIKVAVLALISTVGFLHFAPERLAPLDNKGLGGVIVAAASIFVAYEGFELLSYDYEDLDRPRWTLPRALYLSTAIVTLVYVTVTVGAQMLVSDAIIISQKEVAFAAAGQAALGTAGYWIASLGALLAASSAINATLFSTARQMHEIAVARELPAIFAKVRGGLPVTALVFLAVFGAAFAMLPDITSLLTFGSAVFLAVFGATNLLASRLLHGFWPKLVSAIGFLACLGALVVLVVQLVLYDVATLLLIAGSLALVSGLRLAFVRHQRGSTAGSMV
ncbi:MULTISPECIES: APC family permease [unclassified Arthrobacter]|uniref:APC family permease n=1 Tax=unclassified Arthrobacter TaxID=235627 RepID=UPI001CFFE951|nr:MULTISPECIES: APC family permease [unclassified Arthrobacter]MCB5281333.1 Inner membrane transport protein YbaT [Arthrobacter sp. ES1]WGZ78611.1 APC family permease [Arthrobacter sp. EM1]